VGNGLGEVVPDGGGEIGPGLPGDALTGGAVAVVDSVGPPVEGASVAAFDMDAEGPGTDCSAVQAAAIRDPAMRSADARRERDME
jgi:hypothetical protein